MTPRHQRTRNGKIARLPEATRERINRMIDDGFRYRDIIQALGQPGASDLPYKISEMNLSNWRKGGYREWCRRQEQLELDRQFPLPSVEKTASLRSLLRQLTAQLSEVNPIKKAAPQTPDVGFTDSLKPAKL